MKFTDELSLAVREVMMDPEFIARFKRGTAGKTLYVVPSTNDNYVDFVKTHQSYEDGTPSVYTTIQAAVNALKSGWEVLVAPGSFDETVTVPHSISNIKIESMGGRGATYIEPSTEDAAGMLVHADDVTLVNIGVAAEDETSAVALTVTGDRFRAYGSKFEGGAIQVLIGPGTVAQVAAGIRGKGSDSLFDDCEVCWGTKGIVLQGTDYGGCTQLMIRNCRFHDLTAESIGENVGSGGSAAVTFFGLNVKDSVFELDEAGAAPTKWLSLNADNANSGIISGCRFPTAINGGLNLVSTKVLFVGNYMTGGINTAQPS